MSSAILSGEVNRLHADHISDEPLNMGVHRHLTKKVLTVGPTTVARWLHELPKSHSQPSVSSRADQTPSEVQGMWPASNNVRGKVLFRVMPRIADSSNC